MAKAVWGFDLTAFNSAKDFAEILKACGLPAKPKRRRPYKYELKQPESERTPLNKRPFVWSRPGLRLVTGNDPISGRYCRAGERENEKGYASYIGIEGDRESVEKLAKLISEKAEYIKEETPNESHFIN